MYIYIYIYSSDTRTHIYMYSSNTRIYIYSSDTAHTHTHIYIYKGDPADLNTLRETDAIMLNPVGNWSTSEIQYLYIFNPTLHYPPPIICAFFIQNRCFSTP